MNEKMMGTRPEVATDSTDWIDQIDDQVIDELTADEIAELAILHTQAGQLQSRLDTPRLYFAQKQEDMERIRIADELRVKNVRINELLTGYPQTGSAASVASVRENTGHTPNPAFKLQRRIRFFDEYAHKVMHSESLAFRNGALTMSQLYHYTQRDSDILTDQSPIVVGHLRRQPSTPAEAEELCSYMLVLCSSHPDGPSAFDRDLPDGSVYLNGIWVHPDFRDNDLGKELCSELLYDAKERPIYASVKSDNIGMMHLLSHLGEDFRDPNHKTGPNAGRSRAIELLYWYRYFGDSHDDNRVMTMYDPGIFIPDSIATVRPEDIIDARNVQKHIGRDRIAIYNGPTFNSVNRPRTTHLKVAVSLLLDSGEYIGIPMGNYRLYVRVDSLPPRTARAIKQRYDEVDKRRERDYMTRFGRRILAYN